MNPHRWSIHEIAFLQADVMQEQERTLAHSLAMVVKLTIRSSPQFRTGAVVVLQCGGLAAVSHDQSHHKHIQLIVVHPSKGGSEGLVVFHWEEHGARCLFGPEIIATALADKLLDQITLLVIQVPHHCRHFTHL